MKTRLLILTEIIAPYRIPVFNELAKLPEIDLHVVFLAETDSSFRTWHIYSDEIHFDYEVLPSWRRRIGKYNLLVNANVSAALRRFEPDVLLCGGYNYLASWQALFWAKKNRVPFLLWCESTERDQRNRYSPVEAAKRLFFRSCNGFVVPGKAAYRYVQLMEPSKKIFRAPNAVDNDLFARCAEDVRTRSVSVRKELALPEKYFLFVGRLVRAKGIFELLETYASLDPGLRSRIGLVFAGDGPEGADLRSAARLIFPGKIHFAGFVHREQLAAYYVLAECLVFPTHSDTWGMVVNEAMACGLPVICSDVTGCALDLVHGNGRTVVRRDAKILATAMREIALDPELRARMSTESKALISSYSPSACAAGIADAALVIASKHKHTNCCSQLAEASLRQGSTF